MRAIGQLTLAPFVALYAVALGASNTTAGIAVSAHAFSALCTSPIAGITSSRFGDRTTMLIGIVVNLAAAITGALTGSYRLLLVSRLVQGVGNSLWQVHPMYRLVTAQGILHAAS